MSQAQDSDSLNYLLTQVCKLHYAQSHGLLEQIGLYRGQPPVLEALWRQEGLTHGDLAQQLHVQPATITKMVQRMERTGFVVRQRDTEDERVSRVYLTAKGRAIQADLEHVLHTIETRTYAGFSAEERELLGLFFARMRGNLMQMAQGQVAG